MRWPNYFQDTLSGTEDAALNEFYLSGAPKPQNRPWVSLPPSADVACPSWAMTSTPHSAEGTSRSKSPTTTLLPRWPPDPPTCPISGFPEAPPSLSGQDTPPFPQAQSKTRRKADPKAFCFRHPAGAGMVVWAQPARPPKGGSGPHLVQVLLAAAVLGV